MGKEKEGAGKVMSRKMGKKLRGWERSVSRTGKRAEGEEQKL